MTQQDAIKRWDEFLKKIRERASELFEPARQQGLQMFIDGGNDPIPVYNALNGIRAQMVELSQKVGNTWSEKVFDLMHEAGIRGSQLDLQSAKGDKLETDLEFDFVMLDAEIRKQIADRVVELAKKDQAKVISCTQCLAQLQPPPFTYRAEHITCKFCQTVNTYEPGTYLRMLGGCASDLARWNARNEIKEEMEAVARNNRLRDEAFEKGKIKVKEAKKKYWEKYLTELKAWRPDLDIEKEMSIQMRNE